MKRKLAPLPLALTALATPTLAQQALPALETIRIIGSPLEARALSGSGAVVDTDQLELEGITDIHQALKTVPGVYVMEEEGFGLRPNIGIRAASSERTSKVTVLEDGIMMAPAPYSNPAAYYFPTTARMSAVEVLKGAPLLRYGPQTTGGVVNLVSTPIPESASGKVRATIGEYSQQNLHAYYGDTQGNVGWLIETVQRSSDGFKTIDRSNRDSGFDIQDYVAKLRWTGDRHSLGIKAQYSEEVSNETYLGLTDADFAADPNRRYGLSSIDQMTNDHKGFSANYQFQLNDTVTFNVIGYRNEFSRNWFKIGTSLVEDANAGDATALAILHGELDVDGLNYKNNNRSYTSQGVELNSRIELDSHSLEVGVRSHEDDMDRYQPVEVYNQRNGSLVFDSLVEPTGGDNRLEGADAVSFWITDQWQATDALTVDLVLRYEDVDSYRDQFATPDRSDTPSQRSNSTEEWLPGVSLTYALNDQWQLLAGAHRGFSPLGGGATEQQEPEISDNYEAGVRYQQDSFFAEVIGFYSDFSDYTENCSVGTPCSNGAESGSFTNGEARVNGVEVQVNNTYTIGRFSAPVSLTYTHTSAEITANNAVSGAQNGDELAGIPASLLSLRVELNDNSAWRHYAVAKYMDETCVALGCNRSGDPQGATESLFVVDIGTHYQLNSQTSVFLKLENLFDEQVIIARTPLGPRPNKPQTASVGVELRF